MDAKLVGGLVIGIVIGLLIGYLVWGTADAVTPPDTTPPPPRGEWPNVICPPGAQPPVLAHEVCDQITNLAMAVQPPTADSQYCAMKAQAVKSAQPMDDTAAAVTLDKAHKAAQQGNWSVCRRELDEIGD